VLAIEPLAILSFCNVTLFHRFKSKTKFGNAINLQICTSKLDGPICPYISSLATRSGYYIWFKMSNTHWYSVHMVRKIWMMQYAQYMFVVWPHGQDNLHDSICTIYVCCLTTWPEYFTWANMHNTYLQSDYMVRRVCIISFSSPSV